MSTNYYPPCRLFYSPSSSEPVWSASFQSKSLSAHPAHTATTSLRGCQGRQLQSTYYSIGRQYTFLSSTKSIISSWTFFKLITHSFLLVNSCWLILIIFLSFMCLKMVSRICCSVNSLRFNVVTDYPVVPWVFLPAPFEDFPSSSLVVFLTVTINVQGLLGVVLQWH